MIHLITRISVVGISITTAALVILIAAFNGIEKMVEQLYSEYDTNLTIRSSKGKTFEESKLDIDAIQKIKGVYLTSKAISSMAFEVK